MGNELQDLMWLAAVILVLPIFVGGVAAVGAWPRRTLRETRRAPEAARPPHSTGESVAD